MRRYELTSIEFFGSKVDPASDFGRFVVKHAPSLGFDQRRIVDAFEAAEELAAIEGRASWDTKR